MKKLTGLLLLIFTFILVCAAPATHSFATEEGAGTDPEPTAVPTGRFSQAELDAVFNEITDNYLLNDEYSDIVTSVGTAFGASENGEIITFSEDITEMRVVVSVNSKYYDEYKPIFEKQYGDIVYVESVEVTNPNDQFIIDLPEDDAEYSEGEETGNQDAAITDGASSSQTPTNARIGSNQGSQGYKTCLQIAIGAGLVIIAVIAIIVSMKNKKKNTEE